MANTTISVPVAGKTVTIAYEYFDTIHSTNDYLKEQAPHRRSHVVVVRAGYQTHGRGQFDRTWVSPEGKNLLFSVLLHPQTTSLITPLLTRCAAEAVLSVLNEEYALEVSIKEPNDLICKGKKLAGILTEQETVGHTVQYVIIGIGLNGNAGREELPETATSLLQETGTACALDPLFEKIIQRLLCYYYEFLREKGIHDETFMC